MQPEGAPIDGDPPDSVMNVVSVHFSLGRLYLK